MGSCEEGRLLLAAANRDLTALQGMTDPRVFADGVFGFHAQQAAEKALKAWLCMLDVEYPRTHDLTLLPALLDVEGQDVSPFLDEVRAYESCPELRQSYEQRTVPDGSRRFSGHRKRAVSRHASCREAG